MKNGYNIIKKENLKAMKWSGGTIKELFIYPEKGEYEKRNFIFVISTATVDIEESDFTLLDNFDRIILTLDNQLTLTHNGNEEVTLNKYEPHFFYGGDHTKSRGKANDYNLIMKREECCGEVACLSLAEGSIVYPKISTDPLRKMFEIIFCLKGKLIFQKDSETASLYPGDIIIIDKNAIGTNYIFSNTDTDMCDIIISTVKILN
ncbi:hypothetical protein MASR1M66_15940 [Aminivibrio sp.]